MKRRSSRAAQTGKLYGRKHPENNGNDGNNGDDNTNRNGGGDDNNENGKKNNNINVERRRVASENPGRNVPTQLEIPTYIVDVCARDVAGCGGRRCV